MKVEDFKKEFDKCKDDAQIWELVLKHKDNILIVLDNDVTYIHVAENGEIVDHDDNYFTTINYLGNGYGLFSLFEVVGLKAEHC